MNRILMLLLSFFWLHANACHLHNCSHLLKNDINIVSHNEGVNADNLFSKVQDLVRQSKNGNNPIDIVVIDPGHGGNDKGCSGANSIEKTITLAIGKRLKTMINSQLPDVKVLLTRERDKFVSLKKRAELANKNNADIFISIHCNYLRGTKKFRGSETYVLGFEGEDEASEAVAKRENTSITLENEYQSTYEGFDPYSPESYIMLSMFQNLYLDNSIILAQLVDNELVGSTNVKSHGVKQAGFVVLKETTMPSILIETGYLSNELDEKLLLSTNGQNKVSQAIFNAIQTYKYTFD